MAVYTLPDLTYDYAALEPHISGKIMELHHSKHHATYVKGANTALEQLEEARETGNLANVNKIEKDLA
ncbi:superoxide dismutase, partial [Streptomyces anthocyanicus]